MIFYLPEKDNVFIPADSAEQQTYLISADDYSEILLLFDEIIAGLNIPNSENDELPEDETASGDNTVPPENQSESSEQQPSLVEKIIMPLTDLETNYSYGKKAEVSFILPAGWEMNGTIAYFNGQKSMELGLVYKAVQELPREWFTVDEAYGNEVTVIDEAHYEPDNFYTDLYHTSVLTSEAESGVYEAYRYVIDRNNHSVTVTFTVNEYFDLELCEKILKTFDILEISRTYSPHADVVPVWESSGSQTEKLAYVQYAFPEEWQVEDRSAYIGDEKMFEYNVFEDSEINYDDYKIDEAYGRTVTVLDEEFGDGEFFDYKLHRKTGDEESYMFVIRKWGYNIVAYFYVNDRYDESAQDYFLKSLWAEEYVEAVDG